MAESAVALTLALTRVRLLVAVLAGLAGAPSPASAASLGLCREEAARADGYMQLLCAGEAELAAARPKAAVEQFTAAAALPRLAASNELAWAGLAVAHCRAGDAAAGRDWAQRFDAARRLWLGELACTLADGRANPKVPPVVHQQLCSAALAADYAIVHASPQSAIAQDVRARLDAVHGQVRQACGRAVPAARSPTTAPTAKNAAPTAKAAAAKKKRSAARARGRTASPAPGR